MTSVVDDDLLTACQLRLIGGVDVDVGRVVAKKELLAPIVTVQSIDAYRSRDAIDSDCGQVYDWPLHANFAVACLVGECLNLWIGDTGCPLNNLDRAQIIALCGFLQPPTVRGRRNNWKVLSYQKGESEWPKGRDVIEIVCPDRWGRA